MTSNLASQGPTDVNAVNAYIRRLGTLIASASCCIIHMHVKECSRKLTRMQIGRSHNFDNTADETLK